MGEWNQITSKRLAGFSVCPEYEMEFATKLTYKRKCQIRAVRETKLWAMHLPVKVFVLNAKLSKQRNYQVVFCFLCIGTKQDT